MALPGFQLKSNSKSKCRNSQGVSGGTLVLLVTSPHVGIITVGCCSFKLWSNLFRISERSVGLWGRQCDERGARDLGQAPRVSVPLCHILTVCLWADGRAVLSPGCLSGLLTTWALVCQVTHPNRQQALVFPKPTTLLVPW